VNAIAAAARHVRRIADDVMLHQRLVSASIRLYPRAVDIRRLLVAAVTPFQCPPSARALAAA
jgi:hypothetical protein